MNTTLHLTVLCAALLLVSQARAQEPALTPILTEAPGTVTTGQKITSPMDSGQSAVNGLNAIGTPGAGSDPYADNNAASPPNLAASPNPQQAQQELASPENVATGISKTGVNTDPVADTSASAGSTPLDTRDASAGSGPKTGNDPLGVARAHWRSAVAAGSTDLGFSAWIMAALNPVAPGPAPGADLKPDTQAARTRTVSGRWLARAGPVALGAAGRVVTTFGAAIPTAFCAPLMVCYIELEQGEVLTDTPSWGDTARWQVTVKVQGRDPETVVLEIKPAGDAGLTNLVIPTDRRLYTINLVNDPDVHTPILAFRYPDTASRQAAARIAARREAEAQAEAARATGRASAAAALAAELETSGVSTGTALRDPGTLDFAFRITGTAPFRPVRVYTDGAKTYIDLHPTYRGTLPTVVAGRGEENKALNIRVTAGGTRLVADRVISDIWLQAGSRRVRIQRAGA